MSNEPTGQSDAEVEALSILTGKTRPDRRVLTAFALAFHMTEPKRMAPGVLHATMIRADEISLMDAVLVEGKRRGLPENMPAHKALVDELAPQEGEAHNPWFKRIGGHPETFALLLEGLVAGIVLGADLRFRVQDAVDVKVHSLFIDLKPGEKMTQAKLDAALRDLVTQTEDADDGPEDDREPEKGATDG